MQQPLTRAELHAINKRAGEQGRTVQYIFERDGRKKLRCVRAIIRDFAWHRAA